jgi:hypothetical protein
MLTLNIMNIRGLNKDQPDDKIWAGHFTKNQTSDGLVWCPTVTHACHKRRLKWVPSAWGYIWATLSPGVINTEVWSSRLVVGRWTNNPAP